MTTCTCYDVPPERIMTGGKGSLTTSDVVAWRVRLNLELPKRRGVVTERAAIRLVGRTLRQEVSFMVRDHPSVDYRAHYGGRGGHKSTCPMFQPNRIKTREQLKKERRERQREIRQGIRYLATSWFVPYKSKPVNRRERRGPSKPR